MLYDELPIAQKAAMMRVCIKNGITNPDDIRTAYNNYVEGRNIFDGLSESYQRASAFGQFLANGGHIYGGTTEPTGQMQKKVVYTSPYYPGRKFATQREVRQANWDYKHPEEKKRRDAALRQQRMAAMEEAMRKRQSDYLTISNDNTWVENRDPTVRATRVKNPHLTERSVQGAKAHAAWAEEHPIMNAVSMGLGAVPLAVASVPFVAGAVEAAPTVTSALAPGSAFWMNPLTQQMAASMLGGIAVDATSTLMTGKKWGDNVSDVVNQTTGWNPKDSWLGGMAADMTNPGYFLSPGSVFKGVNVAQEGTTAAVKAVDNATRDAFPKYDLYRIINETTPSVRVKDPFINVKGLEGTDKSYIRIKSPLENFVDTRRGVENEAYYLFAPKNVDITKLRNARFGNGKSYDGPILGSGEVEGKFVSYGEPWMEFAPGENTALYEMPVGPKRGPSLMATDYRGNTMDYSVDEAYNAILRDHQFHKDIQNMELRDILPFKRENYPDLIGGIPTDIYHANQTVIPNKNWNFDKFLKTSFWKYSEDPMSGQVQRELFMNSPATKEPEGTVLNWFDLSAGPKAYGGYFRRGLRL